MVFELFCLPLFGSLQKGVSVLTLCQPSNLPGWQLAGYVKTNLVVIAEKSAARVAKGLRRSLGSSASRYLTLRAKP